MERVVIVFALIIACSACKHPLKVEGQGSIVERIYGERGCTWQESNANAPNCSENAVVDERYLVSYYPVPDPGWRFSHWKGTACNEDSAGDSCEFDVSAEAVRKIDEGKPDGHEVPPTIAVFVRESSADPQGLDRDLSNAITANDITGDPRKSIPPSPLDPLATLGKKLFFSKSLSANFDVACASCHHPALAGGDALSLPIGIEARRPDVLGQGRVRRGGRPTIARNSPTTFNSGLYEDALFWDGRVFRLGEDIVTPDSSSTTTADPRAGDSLLAAQARFPVTAPEEMRSHEFLIGAGNSAVRRRLAQRIGNYGPGAGELQGSTWVEEFKAVFGDLPAHQIVTYDNIALALATYQQSQSFVHNPWKAYVEGDLDAISDNAKRGALVFFRQKTLIGFPGASASCADCHSGDFFTDERFQTIAFPQIGPGIGKGESTQDDLGHGSLFSTDFQDYRFRVPSLLNVTRTGPWGHAGSYRNLRDAVEHYAGAEEAIDRYFNRGGWCQLDQFKDLSNCSSLYPNAEANTRKALEKLESDNQRNRGMPPVNLSATEIDQLMAFLRTLTDPCIRKKKCLAPWVPKPEDAPDDHQLNAINANGNPL